MRKRSRTTSNLIRATATALILTGAQYAPVAAAQDYDFIQIHGLRSKYEGLNDFRLHGAEIRGGFSVNRIFAEIRYRDLRDKPDSRELNEDRWYASLGYAFPSNGKTHYDVRINYGDENIRGTSHQGDLKVSSEYYGLSTFVHHELTQKVRLYAGLEWQDWRKGADQKAYHLGAMYRFEKISVGTEYIKYSDSDALSLFMRYSF